MKKAVSAILLIVVLCNFICSSKSYAADFDGLKSITGNSISGKDMEALASEGSVETKGKKSEFNIFGSIGSVIGTVAGIIAGFLNLFPMLGHTCMNLMIRTSENQDQFTIERAVFGEIGLFDVNYFNQDEYYIVGNNNAKTIQVGSATRILKQKIAQIYILMRTVAMAGSLLVLIYVGIRMATSTVASEKAVYKEMLIGWFESIIILFTLQYIMVAVIGVGKIFTNILWDVKETLISTANATSFETEIMSEMYQFLSLFGGWTYVAYSIAYWLIMTIELKFFVSYLRRVVIVGFLIIISPIMTVIFALDKLGDNKAQAFTVWFSELAMNIFIQPIHAFIYIVFMFSAGEIAKQSMLVAILFMLGMTKIEKIVLRLFNLKNTVTLKPVEDEKTKI